MYVEVHAVHGGEVTEALDDIIEDDERFAHAGLSFFSRVMMRTWAMMTRVMEVMKTNVPMALTCGSMLPVTISRMMTGTVLLRPETNQATANSSKETAAVRHRAEMIAGFAEWHDDLAHGGPFRSTEVPGGTFQIGIHLVEAQADDGHGKRGGQHRVSNDDRPDLPGGADLGKPGEHGERHDDERDGRWQQGKRQDIRP